MKHDYSQQRARRGFAILAALLLAAILVFNLDVVVDWFHGYVDVVAIVTETSDVRVGGTVWVEGVEVGRVDAMALVDPATLTAMADRLVPEQRAAVALHLRIEDRARAVVRKGSQAYTTRERVVGAPVVRIEAGPPGAPPVESGDTLYPADRPSIERLVERGKAFPATLDSLLTGVRELNRLAAARQPGLDRVMDRLTVVTEEATALQATFAGGSLGRWLADPEMGRRVRALQGRVAELSEAAGSLQRYADEDGELRRSAAALSERADRLAAAVAGLEQRLAEGDGMMSRVARDSALAVAVAGVQAQIDSLRAEGTGFALRMLTP